jgi:hypothetical protein
MDSSEVRVCAKPDCNIRLDRRRDLFVAEAARRNIPVIKGHCLPCTKSDLAQRIILAQESKSQSSRLANEDDRKKRVAERQAKEEILPDKVTELNLTRTEAGKILRLTTVEVDGLAKARLLYFNGWPSDYRNRRITKASLRSLVEAVISDPTLKSDSFDELTPALSRRLIKRIDYFAKLYTSGVLDD